MANISRRGFLAIFSAAAAGAVVGDVDLSRLEWSPPASMPELAAMPEAIPMRADALAEQINAAFRTTPRVVRPLFSLKEQARAIARELHRKLGEPDLVRVPRAGRIGDTGLIRRPREFKVDFDILHDDITEQVEPVTMTQWFQVNTIVSPHHVWEETRRGRRDVDPDFLHAAYIAPMAHALAMYVRHHNINAFGDDLPKPGAGVDEAVCETDERSGITVRGIRYFDLYRHEQLTRFDIVGGTR